MSYPSAKILIGKTIAHSEFLINQEGSLCLVITTTNGEIYSTLDEKVELITKEQLQEAKEFDKKY
jgi:hypothetical protein